MRPRTTRLMVSAALVRPPFRGGRLQRARISFPSPAKRFQRRDRAPVRIIVNSTEEFPEEKSLAPSKPQTAFGEMLTYYLKMEPHLFKTTLEDKLGELSAELHATQTVEDSQGSEIDQDSETIDLTLSRRMEEVRAKERRHTVKDLMYISILEKFIILGVDMLPRMDGSLSGGMGQGTMEQYEVLDTETNLDALTQGVHSVEALDLVRQHVLAVMGQTSMALSSAKLKLSKLQMAQIYAASIMFGYFLRGVDKRFQLERSLGLVSQVDIDDAASRLEKLFQETSNVESVDDPDAPSSSSGEAEMREYKEEKIAAEETPSLRKYVESFDVDSMREMAALVSLEGAALVERQTLALFGDVKQLQTEMQKIVGYDAISAEELFQRVTVAVQNDSVSTLLMTVGTQRRAVLEAVAFGTFLRDVEQHVDTEYDLLTPLPAPPDLGGGAPGLPGPESMGF